MPLYHEAVETPRAYVNVLLFVRCCVVEDPAGRVSMSELYASYQAWCNDVGACEVHTLTCVGRLLTSYGVRKVNAGGIKRVGIALRDVPIALAEDVLNRDVRKPSAAAFVESKRKEKAKLPSRKQKKLTLAETREADDRARVADLNKGVIAWSKEGLVPAPDAAVKVSHIYSHYADWCEKSGMDRWSACDLGYSLQKAGYSVTGKGMYSVLVGHDVELSAD